MEKLCVSLETAKKLKAAGFPQESAWLWVLPDEAAPWLTIRDQIISRGKGLIRNHAAAPTAQEIADELKGNAMSIDIYSSGRVSASYGNKYLRSVTPNIGLAGALAALYIEIHEEYQNHG